MQNIRKQFPIFNRLLPNGKKLVYLDSANSSQKPQRVMDRLYDFYAHEYSSVGRSIHQLSSGASQCLTESREAVAKFLNAGSLDEIVFTKSATEAINTIAESFGRTQSDHYEIICSELEHNSNYLPWHLQRAHKNATIKFLPLKDDYSLDVDKLESLITNKTKMIAITQLSNVTGEIINVKKVCEIAHSKGIAVFVDGTQAAQHMKVDVQDIDCDFYCISGHKMYGPSGVGALYAKAKWLDELSPFQGGGGTVIDATQEVIQYADGPKKWEAGTHPVAEIIALKEAIDFYYDVGFDNILNHEKQLAEYLYGKLASDNDIQLLCGNNPNAVLAFNIKGIHHEDMAMFLDEYGIATRPGQHCAMLFHKKFDLTGSLRVSLGVYNNKDEMDFFVDSLNEIKRKLSK
jgi:cysteine desulfurase/selenocysteine lyase